MGSDRIRDAARDVREGDGFDVAAVAAWLEAEAGIAGVPEVQQFHGGASNLTYLLRYWERDLILRRPPPGKKAASAHDMGREVRVQRALKPVYPVVPEIVAFCEDHDVIGSDFYVMERIDGVILRARLPKGLDLTPDQTRAMCLSVLDQMIALHQVDVEAAGLSTLGKGHGYVERQISGWIRRYEAARTWNAPRWRGVMRWLEANLPDDVATVVVHNDFRFDNVVLDPQDPTRVIGVLDWEMATLGDPLMDLGNSLAYWIEADDDRLAQGMRRQPTHLPGMLTRREVIAYYTEKTGWGGEDFRFYQVYGLFRLACIIQQIYVRYHRGETTNPAFKHFWAFNHYLHWRTRKALKGTI